MIEAVIFDMDGLLIDSEPLWREAEIEVFARAGLELDVPMCLQTTGLRIDEAVDYWYRRHPGLSLPAKQVEERIVERVLELIRTSGTPKPGVEQTLAFLRSRDVRLALASSSSYRIIHTVLKRLGLEQVFEVVYSAEEETWGKPHPGVYISTAARLETLPTQCLAIEDSLAGVIAAKAARMSCVAVPDPFDGRSPKFVLADVVLPSLAGIDASVWRRLNG